MRVVNVVALSLLVVVVGTQFLAMQVQQEAASGLACSVNDFEIIQLSYVQRGDRHLAIGEIKSNCKSPAIVQLKTTFKDRDGLVVHVLDNLLGPVPARTGRVFSFEEWDLHAQPYATFSGRISMAMDVWP